MRWQWRRRCAEPSEDAQAAYDQADRALQDAERLHDRASEVADHLAEIKANNHFAASFIRSMRGV